MQNSSYDTSGITVLTLHEAIRKRPGMYIGSLEFKGKKNLILSVIDAYLDKSQDGIATVEIVLKHNDFVELTFESDALTGDFEMIFNKDGVDLNWLVVANMLSQYFEIKTKNSCTIYERGNLVSTNPNPFFSKNTLLFKLDDEIFENLSISYKGLFEPLKERAILNKNVGFWYKDERKTHLTQNYFQYTEGVKQYLSETQSEEDSYTKNENPIFFFEEQIEDIRYEFGFYYGGDTQENTLISYVNNDKLTLHGSLKDGIVDGIIETAQKIISQNLYPKKDPYGDKIKLKFNRKRAMKGLRLWASVKMENPNFGGATKERLDENVVYFDAKKLVIEKLFSHFTSREAFKKRGYESELEGFMRLFRKF